MTIKPKNQIMKNEKYNGWTNYATWRINLEIFDPYDSDGIKVDSESCKDYATELVSEGAEGFALDYALAFLSEVNWHEIAEAINNSLEN